MRNILPIIVLLLFFSCSKNNKTEIPVANVQQGTFYLDIFEEGSIDAIRSTNINSPNISWRYGMLKIIDIVDDGTEVQTGDTLVVFDPSEVRKAIVDSEANLEMKNAELVKLKAEHQSAIVELEADLEITRLSQEISKIEFEAANYEADIKKQEIRLNMEKANIALDKAIEQIENRKKIQQEEIKQKMLEIRQSEQELAEGYETLSNLFLISPSPGIAIIAQNWSSDAKFQIGDQCWSGYTLIELPDLSSLKASVQINEVDISKISTGMPAEIKPDAFSDSIYSAEVLSVANLAVNKDRDSKIKVFPVDILIKSNSENLMPGLTVSCRIIVDKIDDVIFVPLEAMNAESQTDFVYVKNNNGFEKREVETGQRNTDYVIIKRGLKANEKVAMINPYAQSEESQKQ